MILLSPRGLLLLQGRVFVRVCRVRRGSAGRGLDRVGPLEVVTGCSHGEVVVGAVGAVPETGVQGGLANKRVWNKRKGDKTNVRR